MPRQELGDPMETLERLRPPERKVDATKHPTCATVLLILEEAVGILRARLNEGRQQVPTALTEVKPEILALAVGYGFEAMRNRSGPFSTAEMRDGAQRGFIAGWISREFQEKVDGKSDDIRARQRARINSGGKGVRRNRRGV